MSDAARTIVELNIERFRQLLLRDPEPAKRATLAKLLAEEEAKLLRLLGRKNGSA